MVSIPALNVWKCSLCNKRLESATFLPCDDILCLNHLSDYVDEESGILKCPICNKDNTIPEGGVGQFPQFEDFFSDLVEFRNNRKKLQEIETKTAKQVKKIRDEIELEISNINEEFDKIIHSVDKRRQKIIAPYKERLDKLREMTTFLDKSISDVEQQNEIMEEKLKNAEKFYREYTEQLSELIDMCPTVFSQRSHTNMLDIINEFGQIDYGGYHNYKLMSTIDGEKDTEKFQETFDVAVCPLTDLVYITTRSAIVGFDNQGINISKTITDYQPLCITVDYNGRIIVTDDKYHQVRIYNHTDWEESHLEIVKIFGEFGSGNGQFKSPYGVSCDINNNIYIADSYNHRIQVFESNGIFIRMFAQVWCPSFLHLTSNQKLFVTSQGLVRQFSPTGEHDHILGELMLQLPTGICTDDRGYVFIVNSLKNRIDVYNNHFDFVTTINIDDEGKHQGLVGIALTKSGHIFTVNSTKKSKIYILH